MKSVEQFVKERDQMLERFSVEELDKFINENKELYGNKFIKSWKKSKPIVKEMTLCKCVLSSLNISNKTTLKALKRLEEIEQYLKKYKNKL